MASLLLEHAVKLVAVVHVDVGGCLVAPNSLSVEEETKRGRVDALALRIPNARNPGEPRGAEKNARPTLPTLPTDSGKTPPNHALNTLSSFVVFFTLKNLRGACHF